MHFILDICKKDEYPSEHKSQGTSSLNVQKKLLFFNSYLNLANFFQILTEFIT
jgi:hypothetical protein